MKSRDQGDIGGFRGISRV